MDDKKIEEVDVVTSNPANNTEDEERRVSDDKVSSKKPARSMTTYVVSGLIILIMVIGLIFLLEKQGRISTGLFTEIIADMKAKAPAAKVNGVVVPMKDFDSGVKQLVEMAKLQGLDSTSDEAVATFKKEAIDSLVNGELLRQVAIEKGKEATTEDVDARLKEISDEIGEEELNKRMADFGVTKENLRRDIENEILIQSLFESEINKETIEVTDDEVLALYNQANVNNQLPALEEIRDEVVFRVREDKYNQQIGAYIEDLKNKAEIEILIQ
jgi:hypothetical protein